MSHASHQDEIDALVAEQHAFLDAAAAASSLTTTGLPPGRTVVEALERAIVLRKHLWARFDLTEDERLDRLADYCTRLYGGDAMSGKLLTSAAIWEG